MSSTRDIVFKRCGCTSEKTGRQLAARCPHLAEPGHGSWYYAVQVTTVGGRKARYRRGGFATREAAAAARQAILDGPADQAAAGAWTVARWLRYWLAQAGPHLRPSTAHGYRDHIDRYLIPSLGRITLADLTGKRLQACFNLLSRQRTRNGTLIAASTVDRVRATLRSALNAAVREGLIASNPLAHVRLDKPVRPRPVIWTDERVEAWRRDGIRPPVAVWTLRQLITFLTGVENDRLATLWWLIALRGLRRGEAAALDRDDLDSQARELTITRQLIALPGELYCGPPKSRASIRTIALDEDGTRRLVDQAVRQAVELLRHQFTGQRYPDSRARTGPGWRRGRSMFTYADGRPVRPEYLTHRFNTLVKEFDLPPIRLHDLRHGAATLALASHTDLKVIQQMLGHSSIVTTADTYTNPRELHQTGEETAGQQVTGLPEQCSGRPDASPVTWQDPAAIPFDARLAYQGACIRRESQKRIDEGSRGFVARVRSPGGRIRRVPIPDVTVKRPARDRPPCGPGHRRHGH